MTRAVYDANGDGVVDQHPYIIWLTRTAGFTAANSDHGKWIVMQPSSGVTITLPDSTVVSKNIAFNLRLETSQIITFAASGSATIKATSLTMSTSNRSVAIAFETSTNKWRIDGALT
jgi:hypothetical protein